MTQWKKLLKTLGFTDSEAVIYLASIELGPAPVQDLAKQANVSRVTTYAVIESLSERGLMSSVEKGKKKLFVAESPERLVSFVHGRVQEMSATLKEVESTLGELRLLQKGEKPVVKLFEGKEALKAILDDVVASKAKHIDEFGNLDEIIRYNSRLELMPYYKQLDANKTHTRGYYLAKEQEMKPGRTSHSTEVLDPSKFSFGGDIFVYGSKVALSTFRGKQISILIESQDIADTVRAMFDHMSKK